MSFITATKELAVIEDLAVGFGEVIQLRGPGTLINADGIPFSEDKSIKSELNTKETIVDSDNKLAAKASLNGSATEEFSASQGTNLSSVVNLGTLTDHLALKADLIDTANKLALKADIDNVLLKDGTSGEFTPVSPNQPTTKKYVDEILINAGAGDMLKSQYDSNDSGTVDSTEAVGVAGELMGVSDRNQIMRLSQSNPSDCNTIDTFGIFVGVDIHNAPASGAIGLEQLSLGSALVDTKSPGDDSIAPYSNYKAQRCFVADTNSWYDRTYNGSIWSGWSKGAKEDDVIEGTWKQPSLHITLDGTDLNDYSIPGFYRSDRYSLIIANLPDGASGAFTMQLESIYTPDYVRQTLKAHNSTMQWIRIKVYEDWHPWEKVPQASEVAAIKLDIHPIGSVVLRMDDINPSTIYGGTWALIVANGSVTTGTGAVCSGAITGINDVTVPVPYHTHAATFAGTALPAHSHTTEELFGIVDPRTIVISTSAGTHHSVGETITSGVSAGTPVGSVTVASAGVASPTMDVSGAKILINFWQRTA